MTDNGKVEVHLDGELKYRKIRGKLIQVYCMFRGKAPYHDRGWLDIEKFDKDLILIQGQNSIVVPIKPFIELLQEFAKEMEAEEK